MATSPAPIIIDGGSIRSLILIYLALVAAASKIRSTLGREGYIYGYRLLGSFCVLQNIIYFVHILEHSYIFNY